ncbi:MAG TPA: PQQ-binding-like beta-propeller repeat protein [Stellaceae bacterium]|nr:PQQ-binding-like beta-propeller repeat protein [Stellaceae bacterium]
MTKKHFSAAVLGALLVGIGAAPARAAGPTDEVLSYHADAARKGDFIVPGLTWGRARDLHADSGFRAAVAGPIYAQPLFWRSSGTAAAGQLLVATEDDTVYALDAATGRTVWRQSLGTPVPRAALPCGNINPLGITGTPVIDPRTQAVYLDAMRLDPQSGAPTHALFGLSLRDGSVLPGWPVVVAAALRAQGVGFAARNQNQRGALTILGDTVYIPYGGHFGDCASYHGWVVGATLGAPHAVTSWHTAAAAGGIWAPAGISSDGQALYVATGNTMNARQWEGGEAVIRLPPDLRFSGRSADYFAPADWRALDQRDADLGGVAPVLFDMEGKPLALALGKDGKAYLLDRRDLGGIGGALAAKTVSSRRIITSAAVFPAGDGVLVAFEGPGSACPDDSAGGGLTVLKIGAGAPPSLATAWCGAVSGRGAPIATTTDGRSNPIVWMLGAEGDDRLYGFRGDTGERLFVSSALTGLRHFATPIATPDHLYVAADDGLYAFAF